MKKFLFQAISVLLALALSSCGVNEPAEREDPEVPIISENPEIQEKDEPENDNSETAETNERKEVSAENFKDSVEIVLSEKITVGGKSAEESDCVTVGGEIIYYHDMEKYPSGNKYGEGEAKDRHTEAEAAEHTLVTITKPGKYFLRGELKGQIAVDLGENAKDDPKAKVTLIFGGADIVCEIAPAVIFYNVYECETLSAEASANVDTAKAGANVVIAEGSVNNVKGSNVAKIFKDNGEEKKLHKYDSALYSKMSMNIDGAGVLNIEAENEGIGSGMHLTVNGGIIDIISKDDGINTNEDGVSVTAINGGKLSVKGGLGIEGDGIDSNGWLVINGGELFASGNPKSADGGIDADCGIIINGGTVCAFGNKNDRISSESAQLFARLEFAYNEKPESKIEFVDAEGKGVKTESDRTFKSLVISSPEFVKDTEYKLYVNGIMQEFSSNEDIWENIMGEINEALSGFTEGGLGNSQRPEMNEEPKHEIKNPYEVPKELDRWLEKEDIPEEIEEWIETMKDVSENIKPFGNYRPGRNENSVPEMPSYEKPGNENSSVSHIELEEEKFLDHTVFVLNDETKYYSGIFDSSEATGKERVYFTVNGRERMEDVFKGDIPEIESVECTEKVPEKDVLISLTYEGRAENIEISRNCTLAEGYDAIEALFKDLEVGSYCLKITVSEENGNYNGSSEFGFKVVD